MTTKPHPTDALEMPEPDDFSDVPEHAHVWGYTEDKLRAFAIKAYDLALEDAAKKCDEMAKRNFPWASENSDKYHAQADWAELCAAKIRSMKHEQQ